MKLMKIMNNFHDVNIGDKIYYFSYETVIAIKDKNGLTISDNEWGPTTGKHLNWINSDKSIRVPHDTLRAYIVASSD